MAETKGNIDMENFDEPMRDTPPPYSTNPQPSTSAPITQAPMVMHAPIGIGVVGTNVGVVGTNVGIVETNFGVVGTNVGVMGSNVGVVGVNVGQGTAMVPVVVTQQMSPRPMVITCRSCQKEITTRVDSKATWKTHFFAGLLCLMGCWCCCCIPYFTKSCLNGEHYCPNCEAYLGSYTTYN